MIMVLVIMMGLAIASTGLTEPINCNFIILLAPLILIINYSNCFVINNHTFDLFNQFVVSFGFHFISLGYRH